MKQWDRIFKTQGKVFDKVQEDIPRIANLFKKKGVKKILDLGCGSGRHLVYLAKRGFDVYGFDISEYGIKITKEWLRKEKLRASFKIGDIYKKLPYKDNFFDAIIVIQTINHGRIGSIRKLIKEMERILRPKGLIFITARRRRLKNWRINSIKREIFRGSNGIVIFKSDYKVISPRTYIPIDGAEKGLIHYIFNKEVLKKEFKNFKIYNIWISLNRRHYCLLGELKK